MVSLAASWPVAGAARTQAPRLPLTPAGLSILLHGAVAVALTTVALGEGGGMTAPSAPGLAIGIVMAEPAAGAPDRAPGAPGDASADAADPPSEPESPALAVAMAEAPAVAPAADMPDPPPVAPMASALETAPVDPPVPPPPVQAAEPPPVEPPVPAQAAPPRPAAAPRRAAPARSAAVAGRSVATPSAPGPGEGGGTAGRQTAALPAGSDAGGIPLILDPNFRARTRPPYPRRAVELGQQGEVVVEALVDAAGVPLSAHVHRSSGFPLLDEAALAAVRAWRFVPAHHAGQAVASRVRLPVRFRLNG